MINKHSIYNWLFFPILAFLLASSTTSCSNDPAMEETDTSGKSTLSITVRGISITEPIAGESYDDYVKTLRIIGYDHTGAVVCNKKYSGDELGKVEGTAPDTYIKITQTLENTFQGGVCDFYFIANEEGYSVYNTQKTLSDFLEEAHSKEELNNCIIAFNDNNGFTPRYPILMTVHSTSQFLKPGDNEIERVKLIRCIATLQFTIKTPIENINIKDQTVYLKGKYPDSFSLFNINYSDFKLNNIPNVTLSPVDINEEERNNGIIYSGKILFPEQLTDTQTNYSFSININGESKPYTPAVVNEGTLIERNNWYHTIATYDNSSIETSYEVSPWTIAKIDIPEFE